MISRFFSEGLKAPSSMETSETRGTEELQRHALRRDRWLLGKPPSWLGEKLKTRTGTTLEHVSSLQELCILAGTPLWKVQIPSACDVMKVLTLPEVPLKNLEIQAQHFHPWHSLPPCCPMFNKRSHKHQSVRCLPGILVAISYFWNAWSLPVLSCVCVCLARYIDIGSVRTTQMWLVQLSSLALQLCITAYY